MLSQACVKNSVYKGGEHASLGGMCGRGGGMDDWGEHVLLGAYIIGRHAWQGVCVPGGHVWWGACMARGMHGRCVCVAGHAWHGACMAGGHVWHGACMAGRGHA